MLYTVKLSSVVELLIQRFCPVAFLIWVYVKLAVLTDLTQILQFTIFWLVTFTLIVTLSAKIALLDGTTIAIEPPGLKAITVVDRITNKKVVAKTKLKFLVFISFLPIPLYGFIGECLSHYLFRVYRN